MLATMICCLRYVVWLAGSEIRQILQGVTEWVSSMVDDNADPFGDLASLEKAGELSSITAHVADAISQMAGTWDALGANDNMDVEITYEFDLAVGSNTLPHFIAECCCFVCHHETSLPS